MQAICGGRRLALFAAVLLIGGLVPARAQQDAAVQPRIEEKAE